MHISLHWQQFKVFLFGTRLINSKFQMYDCEDIENIWNKYIRHWCTNLPQYYMYLHRMFHNLFFSYGKTITPDKTMQINSISPRSTRGNTYYWYMTIDLFFFSFMILKYTMLMLEFSHLNKNLLISYAVQHHSSTRYCYYINDVLYERLLHSIVFYITLIQVHQHLLLALRLFSTFDHKNCSTMSDLTVERSSST